MAIIPVPEWLPDQFEDGSGTPNDNVIQNVVSEADFYVPWPSLTVLTGETGQRPRGAIGAIDTTRNGFDYAGDIRNLYRLVSLSWVKATNVTLSATYSYSTSTDQWWEFEQWGNTVLATNGFNPVQEITLGSANFVDLAGTPPVAYHMAIIKDFVMLGNLSGNPQRVQWCAINNTHSWTVDAATQADFQDLPGDGGHVQKIIGGNVATIFQERAIWMAQYIGSPAIFSFGNGPVVRNIGLYAPQSAAAFGGTVFFLAEGGFYRIDAGTVTAIGRDKIDNAFFNDLDTAWKHFIQATVDPVRKLYLLTYPGVGNVGGIPNRILAYNWETGRWTLIDESATVLWRHVSTPYTLEALDGISTSLDALPASLDSPLWAGGEINLAAFNLLNRTALFNGTAKDGLITIPEFAPFDGRRGKITRVRPLVDNNAASVTPLTRNRLADARTIGTEVSQNTSGDCPIRVNAGYVSFRINTTGEFKRVRGLEILEVADAGTR